MFLCADLVLWVGWGMGKGGMEEGTEDFGLEAVFVDALSNSVG